MTRWSPTGPTRAACFAGRPAVVDHRGGLQAGVASPPQRPCENTQGLALGHVTLGESGGTCPVASGDTLPVGGKGVGASADFRGAAFWSGIVRARSATIMRRTWRGRILRHKSRVLYRGPRPRERRAAPSRRRGVTSRAASSASRDGPFDPAGDPEPGASPASIDHVVARRLRPCGPSRRGVLL